MPLETRQQRISTLSRTEISQLQYLWEFWARPEQIEPPGRWTYWLIKAGRGFGKTRAGSEMVRKWARTESLVNVVGATLDDARDIMIEGESGILAVCPNQERPRFVKHERKLSWPNGAITLIFTADEPERMRGKQHRKIWADELAAWRYPETWDQIQFGLRLGTNPQAVITTTPRPTPIIKALMANPHCVVTGGTSYHNRDNLAESFYSTIVRRYEGTRLGRQELNAELLDDNPAALWRRSVIDSARVTQHSVLRRCVCAIDPAVTSREDSDETGIVAAGVGAAPHGWQGVGGPHFYVFADDSCIATPEGWARTAVKRYHDSKCDRIIAESNNGGEMVESTLRNVDRNVPVKLVTASRGKMIRAEPVAALYEQGRVHHVGSFPQLEDQMCDYDPLTAPWSPDRMDALVWAISELMDNQSRGILDYMREQHEAIEEQRRPHG